MNDKTEQALTDALIDQINAAIDAVRAGSE